MTDDDKLELLDKYDEKSWAGIQKYIEDDEDFVDACFKSIERCQRIRANLGTATEVETSDERRDRLKIFWRRSSFSARICTYLGWAGIDEVQLAQMTNNEILRIDGLGEKALWEIRQEIPAPRR